jgi:hypothetical protein
MQTDLQVTGIDLPRDRPVSEPMTNPTRSETREDTLDIAQGDRVQAILRREVLFVALIDKKGKSKGLIERTALNKNIAKRLSEVS